MANVFVYDEFSPEDSAMMQALYSRSPLSVVEHANKVKESGSGKFMEKFYVGYGHMSIADCGSTTIFIEQVSILADKAIQDWPLYSGQETSTRYIDMSKQLIIDPVATKESAEILKNWMDFYIGKQEELRVYLKEKYPIKDGENPDVYEKAIAARSFDTMRGFLPAGITTQLSWHTNLRQAWDKLALLRYHPLAETRETAEKILNTLKEKYPNSFGHKAYEAQEEYRKFTSENFSFFNPENSAEFSLKTSITNNDLVQYEEILTKRPMKTNLPLFLGELGNLVFDFHLDYGSFRDLQRHRNGTCRMPLLTTKIGFNEWYISELSPALQEKARELIDKQAKLINNLDTTDEIKQYYTAMGFNVACRVSYGLPATVYTTELRSGRLVHPTLRTIAHKMHNAISEKLPLVKLHSDLEPSDWDIRRGLQDITKK